MVLRGVVSEIYSAMAFVFFLTYGFVGLELVAIKLMSPFGDGRNDLNVSGMREATARGIERDIEVFGEVVKLRDPRLEYSRQKPRPPMKNIYDDSYPNLESVESPLDSILHTSHGNVYHPAP